MIYKLLLIKLIVDPYVIMKDVKDAESLAIDILTFLTLNHDSEMQPQNEEVQPENNGLSDSDMELLQLLKSLTPEMKAMLLKQSASK